MPASISLARLSWSIPDGSPVFTDLTLSFPPERTGLVGRNGVGKSTLLQLIAGSLTPQTGEVRVRGSLAMMRQTAMTRADDTIADLLGVTPALALLARAAEGQAGAAELAKAEWDLPSRIEAALLRCGLAADPSTPLATLSGGQRSRAALAAMVLAEPDFLLLDEPTNNLDRDGRQAVHDLLRGWRGGAIIATHDRELLEEMDAIVELTTLGATRYGGNYSAYRDLKAAELAAAAQDLAHAEKTREEVSRRAIIARERKARKDGAGKRARAKGGQSKMALDAAKARAEASYGAGERLREDRAAAADATLAGAREKLEILQPLQMAIAPTGLPRGKLLLALDRVTAGYTPGRPVIRDLSLTLTGPERVVIAGPNGSGKTTLLRLITGQLAPDQGLVQRHVPFALLDQHLELLDPEQSLLANMRRLNPGMDANPAHAALARFGFRARDALREAGTLSGGQRLRAGLACTLAGAVPPPLLILDEPTNHLDLDGITALEAALASYDGAALVISHDAAFLHSLQPSRVIDLSP